MTEQPKCDFMCGRIATKKIGELNVCEQCADDDDPFPEADDRVPFRRLEDVISLDDIVDDDEVI